MDWNVEADELANGPSLIAARCSEIWTVHERVVLTLLGLAFERKQIPRFVVNTSS